MGYVVGRLPIASSPVNILAGADEVVSQINKPGTAAQTKIVRIISQTAVIFSTIDQFTFICLYKFSNQRWASEHAQFSSAQVIKALVSVPSSSPSTFESSHERCQRFR